jgi:hypothetical protein
MQREMRAMGLFIPDKKPSFPPPRNEQRDRFGLPLDFTNPKGEQERQERLEQIRELVTDAVTAVIFHVGRAEARRLFLAALRPPPKGRKQDSEENSRLLAAYDRAIACGVRERNAALEAAKEMVTSKEDLESIAKQIRRVVKERSSREMIPSTLIGRALRDIRRT